MTKEELINKYDYLYDVMSHSNKPSNMKTFGEIEKSIFYDMAVSHSEIAKEWLDKLEAICWDNYLTEKEAKTIVSKMNPTSKWSIEQILKALEDNHYTIEHSPHYNKYALATTVAMISSDDLCTIKKLMPNKELTEAESLHICYELALDKLKDEDGVFNIRKYFNEVIM